MRRGLISLLLALQLYVVHSSVAVEPAFTRPKRHNVQMPVRGFALLRHQDQSIPGAAKKQNDVVSYTAETYYPSTELEALREQEKTVKQEAHHLDNRVKHTLHFQKLSACAVAKFSNDMRNVPKQSLLFQKLSTIALAERARNLRDAINLHLNFPKLPTYRLAELANDLRDTFNSCPPPLRPRTS